MSTTTGTLPNLHLPGRGLPPGPSGRWRTAWRFMRNPLEYPAECARRYGDVVRLPLPGWDAYVLSNPEHIEEVLVRRHREFIKDRYLRELKDLLGRGLLTSEGSFWKRQRRLAQPAFHHKRLIAYGQQMASAAGELADEWVDGAEVDIHDEMMRLTLVIVARTLFGAEVADDADSISRALEVVMQISRGLLGSGIRIPLAIPTPGNLRYRRAVRTVDRVVYRIIAAHRREHARGRRPSDHNDEDAVATSADLLDMLMAARDDDGQGMSDEQLRDEAVTLFLAGHETTALALTYAILLLAEHPASERALRDELDRVLGGRRPDFGDLDELVTTGQVVKETMRLYPPAWAVGREPLEDLEIGGFEVPKGTQLFLGPWITHRDPRWFPEPTRFRPERWTPEFEKDLPRFAYWPFGGGPRICIGNRFAMMEATLVLATLMQRWRFSRLPGQTLRLFPSVTLRPKSGTRVNLHAA